MLGAFASLHMGIAQHCVCIHLQAALSEREAILLQKERHVSQAVQTADEKSAELKAREAAVAKLEVQQERLQTQQHAVDTLEAEVSTLRSE